ncbi:ligand-binding domain of nuclear hormone receptor domain-containing protein [Ditylenchus destructor]|nr:ligand-binding domain of nuclear hormone receptor domain-containing protein [Ditylenchus destructor]
MKMLKTEIFDTPMDAAEANTSMKNSLDDDADDYEDIRAIQRQNIAAQGGSTCLTCLVCGDVATGRHYGSVACNGCKGFFRRTIRRGYKYSCRFNGNCQIDKHNRAVCRACRYARCIHFGMKVDAVQNERDLIGKRARSFSSTLQPNSPCTLSANSPPPAICVTAAAPHSSVVPAVLPSAAGTNITTHPATSSGAGMLGNRKRSVNGRRYTEQAANYEDVQSAIGVKDEAMSDEPGRLDPWDSSNGLLELLLKSEEKIISLRETVIKETGKLEYTTKREQPRISANGRKATVNDIFHSLHSQLLLVIEWAKNLKPFAELSTEDQTALLKNFASQHIVLCVAFRSIGASDTLKLINDSCIPRVNGDSADENEDFYRKDCERVMDTLVAPMRFMQMDDVEFVAMKACILFNPVAKGLSDVMKVLRTRRKIFAALHEYTQKKFPREPDRIGDLTFFILSPLQSLAKSVSEDVLVTKLSGVARIDQLMEELILEDTEPKERPGHLNKSLSTSADFSEEQKAPPISPASAPAGLPFLAGVLSPSSHYRGRNDTCSSGSSSSTSPPLASLHAPNRTNMRNGAGNGQPISALSPIHDFEMFSTLSSYVLGGPLQGPIVSPSNDVLLSSSSVVSEPALSPSPAVNSMSNNLFSVISTNNLTPSSNSMCINQGDTTNNLSNNIAENGTTNTHTSHPLMTTTSAAASQASTEIQWSSSSLLLSQSQQYHPSVQSRPLSVPSTAFSSILNGNGMDSNSNII